MQHELSKPLTDEELQRSRHLITLGDAMECLEQVPYEEEDREDPTDRDMIERYGVNPDRTPVDAFINSGYGWAVHYE